MFHVVGSFAQDWTNKDDGQAYSLRERDQETDRKGQSRR